MKKVMWWVGLVLLAALVVSACSKNENNHELVGNEPSEENVGNVNESENSPDLDQEQEQNQTEHNDSHNEEENNPGNDEVDEPEDIQPTLTPADLEGGVAIGSSVEDIQTLLGEEYIEVIAALTGEAAWRYDIDTIEGYQYESHTDTPDLDGLTKGDLTMQIFIFFNAEEKVTGYSAYESKRENETIDVYHLMEDGSRITEQIN